MISFKKFVSQMWEKIFVLGGVSFVLLPISPANMPLTYRDSGVFLYIGWRILNGELPYRDIWDHKPPLIFYINALGLALSNNSRWGVWLIEFIALTLATGVGYYLIKKILGTIPALLSTLLWLQTLVFIIQGGNLTTEYTLPLQFVALYLVHDIDKPHIPYSRYFLIGFIGALAFFTKQTAIGIWIAIILYLTNQRFASRKVKQWGCELLAFSAGGLTVLSCIAIFFFTQGAFPQFWDAAFNYNFIYTSENMFSLNRLKPFIFGIAPFTITGLFQFSLMGYLYFAITLLFNRSLVSKWLPLMLIGLIDLPIELLLINILGNTYSHYYMTLLPVLSLFAGILFWIFNSQLSGWKAPAIAKYIFSFGSIGILLWNTWGAYHNQVINFSNEKDEAVIHYITDTTNSSDYVLFWGAEATTNYFTQRKAPTRFVYQYPLYKQGYTNEQMIEEFLGNIIQNQPRLIIDTKNTETPIYDFPIHTTKIDTYIAYIQSHYHPIEDIGHWTVYQLK